MSLWLLFILAGCMKKYLGIVTVIHLSLLLIFTNLFLYYFIVYIDLNIKQEAQSLQPLSIAKMYMDKTALCNDQVQVQPHCPEIGLL